MIFIVLSILSLVLYFKSPLEYSQEFCLMCLSIYLVDFAIVYKKNLKDSLIRFEFFFMLAYLCTNFVYPVFLYPVTPYFSLFNLEFNESYICKACAISTVAINFFSIGITHQKNKLPLLNKPLHYYKRPYIIANHKLTMTLTCMFIPYLFLQSQLGTYSTEYESSLLNTVLMFLIYFSIVAIFWNNAGNYKSLLLSNVVFWALIFVYLALFLIIGSRTIPLRVLMLALILMELLLIHVRKRWVIVGIICGVVGMAFIGIIRIKDGSGEGLTFMNAINDLVINNRSLYVLMEQGDNHGYTYGLSMSQNILAIIPFLQSIFLKITGLPLSDISSGVLVTDLYFDNLNTHTDKIGLGTNVVGDVYVSFGLIGVIIFFYFAGRIINKLFNGLKSGSFVDLLLYVLIFMDAVYVTRSPFFTSLRPLVWCFVIFYLCNAKGNRYKKIRINENIHYQS